MRCGSGRSGPSRDRLLFAAVFGFFRHLSGANTYVEVPYVPYVYSGLLLWTYFTDAATNAASAVRMDVALLSKIYYPRLLTPLVPTVSNLVTILIGMVPLSIIMVWNDVHPGWVVLFLPIVILPCIIFALGLGLLVSALSIEDRDWERVLAFGLTIGLWIAPVIYSPEMIPDGVREIYHLNPMSGTLLGFRAVLFNGVPFPAWEWALLVDQLVRRVRAGLAHVPQDRATARGSTMTSPDLPVMISVRGISKQYARGSRGRTVVSRRHRLAVAAAAPRDARPADRQERHVLGARRRLV